MFLVGAEGNGAQHGPAGDHNISQGQAMSRLNEEQFRLHLQLQVSHYIAGCSSLTECHLSLLCQRCERFQVSVTPHLLSKKRSGDYLATPVGREETLSSWGARHPAGQPEGLQGSWYSLLPWAVDGSQKVEGACTWLAGSPQGCAHADAEG